MTNETTRNFLQVMESFQWPEPKPISHRLYHDEQGRPLCYTMEDVPGTYIEISAYDYARASFQVRVQDGQLVDIQPKAVTTRLQIDPISGTPCDVSDVCVIVELDKPHRKWRNMINEID